MLAFGPSVASFSSAQLWQGSLGLTASAGKLQITEYEVTQKFIFLISQVEKQDAMVTSRGHQKLRLLLSCCCIVCGSTIADSALHITSTF